MAVTTISEHRCCDGVRGINSHDATSTNCDERLSVFVLPQAAKDGPEPERTGIPVGADLYGGKLRGQGGVLHLT